MTRYDTGRRFEWATRDRLSDDGYDLVARTAGSKTKVDLVAIKPGQVLLVQCKADGKLRPAERAALLRLASLLPGVAVPLLAYKPGVIRHPVAFHVLTGQRPQDRRPWVPDEVVA